MRLAAQRYQQAQGRGIDALQRFAGKRNPYPYGIVPRCRYPLNTRVVEGTNKTVKVIKLRTYGNRDQESFFLKIRRCLPRECAMDLSISVPR